jgi:hypothetical protein
MTRLAPAAAICALALLTYFQFPGHTWLQQDSQIYAPILEHQRDPTVLANDIVVEQPHVAYTLYDEAAQALRAVSGQSFELVLAFEQIAARALGIWGIYLMAGPLGAAIFALGSVVAGPAVLTFEYEPTPRAIAVPLLLLAMGLASRRRYAWAAVAAGCAFLYHAPTTWPVLAVFIPLAIWRKEWRALGILASAVAVLAAVGHGQSGQTFFGTLTPLQEQLQRMRAAYVWISLWPTDFLWHWLAVAVLAVAAFWRTRRELTREMAAFAVALPSIGILTIPASWLLLERAKWALIPQVQPLRALLFTLLAMQILVCVAAARALAKRHWMEGGLWLLIAYLPALESTFPQQMLTRRVAVAALFAALTTALWRVSPKWAPAAAVVALFTIPSLAGVVNYPKLNTPALSQLSDWARRSTPPDAVFLFPDLGHALEPGVFRAEALRTVYVDWKGGGQVNYLRDFATVWWFRWQQTMLGFHESDLPRYDGLGVRYIVLRKARLGRAALFQNADWAVYDVRPRHVTVDPKE